MSASSWMHRVARSTVLVALLAACGDGGAANGGDEGSTVGGELTGTIALTRQRDLLDRGLVNVFVHNRGDHRVVLTDVSLDVDVFDAPPAADRSITVRPGREIAIQVPFGRATDCVTDQPVAAWLRFGSSPSTQGWPRQARLSLGGTDVLDVIRAEQCASRVLADTVRTTIDGVQPSGDTVTADLVMEHTGGPTVEIVGLAGTILVAATATPETLGPRLVDGDTLVVPLTFRVNRCDPHAMAEVTKRFGIELRVSIDGAEPADVPIDVAPLEADLERLVEQCRTAAVAEETATTTCGALHALDNRMVELVNTSVAGISSLPPADRRGAVLDGLETVEREVIAWRDAVGRLALPDSAHAASLVGQMRDGAEAAVTELDAQRAAFEARPSIVPDGEVQGLVGTWFNTVEKVMSVLEPEVVGLDDPVFEQAFLDEPTCRHVVQQYVVD